MSKKSLIALAIISTLLYTGNSPSIVAYGAVKSNAKAQISFTTQLNGAVKNAQDKITIVGKSKTLYDFNIAKYSISKIRSTVIQKKMTIKLMTFYKTVFSPTIVQYTQSLSELRLNGSVNTKNNFIKRITNDKNLNAVDRKYLLGSFNAVKVETVNFFNDFDANVPDYRFTKTSIHIRTSEYLLNTIKSIEDCKSVSEKALKMFKEQNGRAFSRNLSSVEKELFYHIQSEKISRMYNDTDTHSHTKITDMGQDESMWAEWDISFINKITGSDTSLKYVKFITKYKSLHTN